MTRQPTVQPDLFGELDAAQERARLDQLPQTCPCCGTTERNGFLLRNNHGGWGDEPPGAHTDGLCVAQWLTRNHITHAVQTGNDEALIRAATRGRELGLDVDGIMLEALPQD